MAEDGVEGTSELTLRASSVQPEMLLDKETFSLEFPGLRESDEAYDPLPFPRSFKTGGRKASMADLAPSTSRWRRSKYCVMSVTRSKEVVRR